MSRYALKSSIYDEVDAVQVSRGVREEDIKNALNLTDNHEVFVSRTTEMGAEHDEVTIYFDGEFEQDADEGDFLIRNELGKIQSCSEDDFKKAFSPISEEI